jgi:ribosomal protein S27AE
MTDKTYITKKGKFGEERWMFCPRCRWEGWAFVLIGGHPCCPTCYGEGVNLGGHAERLKIFEIANLGTDIAVVDEEAMA